MTRQRWASRTVFLLAAVGSAVGLGNVWRFPYLAGRYGGGAFLVPYSIALILIGIPLLMLEFAVGQKMQQGTVGSFRRLNRNFGGLGIFALFSGFIIVSYYAVVMAWCLVYLLASFKVPWSSNSETYFYENVLQLSDGISAVSGINWQILLALALVWLTIYFCVWQGTTSVGKIVPYSVPLPILLLLALLIRAVTLPGFLSGWQVYLTPNWSSLIAAEVWTAAFSQTFYTLTLAFGIMIVYASYKDREDDIAKNTWLTAIINGSISLFAGLVVFAILGYMSLQTNTPVTELAASGPGLAFVVFPEALSLMPLPWLFSLMFFLTLFSLGIDSAFSIVEALNAAILDERGDWQVSRVSMGICCLGFIAGIIYTTKSGLYFLDLVDHFVTNYNLILVGIFQSILAGWLYGSEKLRRYINSVSEWQVGKWWNIAIKYVVPMVLVALIATQFSTDINTPYEDYPGWLLAIGWSVVLVPLLMFVILLVMNFRKRPL